MVKLPARKNGPKSGYDPKILPDLHKLCLLGYDDARLAEYLEVSPECFKRWKRQYKELAETLRSGKDIADGTVAASLYMQATGYTKIVTESKVIGEEVVLVDYPKYYAPSVTAALAWLNNRQRMYWRQRREDSDADDKINIHGVLPD